MVSFVFGIILIVAGVSLFLVGAKHNKAIKKKREEEKSSTDMTTIEAGCSPVGCPSLYRQSLLYLAVCSSE